jgi:hypothetical protein
MAKSKPTGQSRNEVMKAVVALLRETEGVCDIELGRGRKHPFVKWEKDGRKFTFFGAGTPSDRRTVLNSIAKVRRMMRRAEEELQGRGGCSRSTSRRSPSGCSWPAPSSTGQPGTRRVLCYRA